MKNRNRVPTKQWRKWSAKAHDVFNEVYSFAYDNPDLMTHPAAPKPKPLYWKTVAWNAAWIAADAVDKTP